ncbi:hypothetical protein MNB_SV-6-1237 [hydrothermal vent metagenome]|uniref:L,D-TPase catalytic domain-containing protein n=1 Tax=hydrothermal vent metagenome TaxID=652676 RepID=A0A1W1BA51_9ZZZZ
MHAESYSDIGVQYSHIDRDQSELLQSIQNERVKLKTTRDDNNRKLQEEVLQMKILLKKKEAEDIARAEREITKLKKYRKKLYLSLKRERKQKKIQRERAIRAKRDHIVALIDLSSQKMKVYQGNKLKHQWRVSTARKGYSTPVGKYKPQSLEKMHYSKLYHNSPMPYTVFFSGNYAIHGTNSISRLGRRASHGCVRLHPKNAKVLYSMIQKSGKNNTEIKITY